MGFYALCGIKRNKYNCFFRTQSQQCSACLVPGQTKDDARSKIHKNGAGSMKLAAPSCWCAPQRASSTHVNNDESHQHQQHQVVARVNGEQLP
jgi:hypothetical protein